MNVQISIEELARLEEDQKALIHATNQIERALQAFSNEEFSTGMTILEEPPACLPKIWSVYSESLGQDERTAMQVIARDKTEALQKFRYVHGAGATRVYGRILPPYIRLDRELG